MMFTGAGPARAPLRPGRRSLRPSPASAPTREPLARARDTAMRRRASTPRDGGGWSGRRPALGAGSAPPSAPGGSGSRAPPAPAAATPATPPRPRVQHAATGAAPPPPPPRNSWMRTPRSRDRSAWPWTGCETAAARDRVPAPRPPAPRGAFPRPLPRRPSAGPPRVTDRRWFGADGVTRGQRRTRLRGRAPLGLGSRRGAAPPGGGGSLLRGQAAEALNSSHGYISYAVFCLKKKNYTSTH